MAVQFDTPITRGVTEWAALPEELEVDPKANGRHELPNIDWIIDSIMTFGQIQPVVIRKTGGKPVLVAGFSRWRAVNEINKRNLMEKPLKLRCSYTALNEKQAFLANIEENRVRNPTTPMDDAYNIQRLINVHQMTEEEISNVYRESVKWVKDRLQLIEAVRELETEIRAGTVPVTAAKEIAKLSGEHQKNLAKVAKANGRVTKEDIRKEVGKPQKSPLPAVKTVLELADALYRLTIDPNMDLGECELAAHEYGRARGLEK